MIDTTLEWMGRVAIADGLLSQDEEAVIREYAELIDFDCESYIDELRRKSELVETRAIEINGNVLKGIEFENYVFEQLNAIQNIDILSRSADLKLGKGECMDKRSLSPDFSISHTFGHFDLHYWIECKYRTKPDTLSFRESQIERYMSVEFEGPVLILYGEGGKPSAPEKLYIFELGDIRSEFVARRTPKGNYVVKSEKLKGREFDINNLDKYIRWLLNT